LRRLVLDAAVVVAWCFEDEKTPYTERLLDLLAAGGEALVPAVWPAEVTNALLSAERSRRIALAQVRLFLDRLAGFAITIDPVQTARAFDSVLSVARERNLTTYDAAYLELALRERLPLATLDRALRKAAKAAGVAILEG
jgi:predicted nucleic acid-binding protein